VGRHLIFHYAKLKEYVLYTNKLYYAVIFIDSGGCLILEVLIYQLSMICSLCGTWPLATGCTKAILPWPVMKVSSAVHCLHRLQWVVLVFCEKEIGQKSRQPLRFSEASCKHA